MKNYNANNVIEEYERFKSYLKKFLMVETQEPFCVISRITNNSDNIVIFWEGNLPHSSIVNTIKLNEWIKDNWEI